MRDNFIVVQVNRLARVGDDGRDVAGEKVLTLSDAEHQRTPPPRADDHPGHVRMNHRDAIGADHLAQRLADGLDQRSLCLLLPAVESRPDQVGKNLGVGLRLENWPFSSSCARS